MVKRFCSVCGHEVSAESYLVLEGLCLDCADRTEGHTNERPGRDRCPECRSPDLEHEHVPPATAWRECRVCGWQSHMKNYH